MAAHSKGRTGASGKRSEAKAPRKEGKKTKKMQAAEAAATRERVSSALRSKVKALSGEDLVDARGKAITDLRMLYGRVVELSPTALTERYKELAGHSPRGEFKADPFWLAEKIRGMKK